MDLWTLEWKTSLGNAKTFAQLWSNWISGLDNKKAHLEANKEAHFLLEMLNKVIECEIKGQ